MTTHDLFALARQASTQLSRRESVTAMGGAALAALAGAGSSEAKKSRKSKRKKRRNGESEDRCPAQVQPCTTFFDAFCGGRPECLTQRSCCLFLETCEVNTFLTCLINQS